MMQLECVTTAEQAKQSAMEFIKINPDIDRYYTKIILIILSGFFIVFALSVYFISFITWYCSYAVILIGDGVVLHIVIRSYLAFNSSCNYDKVNIKELPQFKDKELINECWLKASHWNKDIDIFDQLTVGYCSYAAINSVLSSIFKQRMFVKYPKKPKAMSLDTMYKTMQDIILENKLTENISVQKIEMNDNMTLQQFTDLIKQTDNNKIRYIANFNRAPLFYCNYSNILRYFWWLRSGHFSAIIGYIDDDNDEMFVLIADCNDKYANYMVPIDRLYQATKCKKSNGIRRGLIRFAINDTNSQFYIAR